MADRSWYRTGEVAAICGVSDGTVRAWHGRGLLAGWRLPGADRRFDRDEVHAFLRRHGIPDHRVPVSLPDVEGPRPFVGPPKPPAATLRARAVTAAFRAAAPASGSGSAER